MVPLRYRLKTLYFFLTVLALSAAATVANIRIRYNAKTLQFAIFGTRVICVFYSILIVRVGIGTLVFTDAMYMLQFGIF